MFKNIEVDVINFINEKTCATFIQIVRKFQISSSLNKKFSIFLNQLKNDKKIFYSKKNDAYFIPKLVDNFDVDYLVDSKGFGFCIVQINELDTKVRIWKNDFNILKNDLINVDVYENIDYENSYFAIVNSIKKRTIEYIYATIDEKYDINPIFFNQKIEFKYLKENLKPNTYVKFKIKSILKNYVELELVQIISNIDDPYSDMNLIINYFNVDNKFNENTLLEANNIENEISGKNKDNRIDLTNELVVTIDGEKTKDFDDAISVVKKDKSYILKVHIADVSYYVKEDSFIDQQALERGTSIYLLNKVIPMLPEKLSNGICSLNPNVDRYTITLESEIDFNGNPIYIKFYPSTINSKYRLTYNQVENYEVDSTFHQDEKLKIMIENSFELSKILSNKKQIEGYINFEISEPIIDVDINGKVINISNKKRLNSEIMIENFMVFANEQVSEYIAKLNIPSIYRIHEAPLQSKMSDLKATLKTLNLNNIKIKENVNPNEFQKIFNEIKLQRFDEFIKVTLLRTMQKAKYSSDNVGHFGLASKYYSHFTSPIRRYPDLLLHRIIRNVIFNKDINYTNRIKNRIFEIAKLSSKKEEDALIVERKLNDIKKAEYFKENIEKIYDATIVSFLKFAIFVELENKISVMIHVSTISNLKPELKERETILWFNESIYFKLGQKVKVKIKSINEIEGKIDGELVFNYEN